MKKILVILSFLLMALFVMAFVSNAVEYSTEGYSITQITQINPTSARHPQINDNGYVVWDSWGDIFLYDGTDTIQLTKGSSLGRIPQVNNNEYVVWGGKSSSGDTDYEIFLYDGTDIIQLSDNDYNDYNPQINDAGYVVWHGSDDGLDSEIFFFNGITNKLTDNTVQDKYPQIDNSMNMVWMQSDGNDYEIHHNNLGQLIINDYDDHSPQISDAGYVVWSSENGIFLCNGTDTIQLPNSLGARDPQVNDNGDVVWSSDFGIFLYNGTDTVQLSNHPFAILPHINDSGYVVWCVAYHHLDYLDIYLYNGVSPILLRRHFPPWPNINHITDLVGSPWGSDHGPKINNSGDVTWETGNKEIFLAKPLKPSIEWVAGFGGSLSDYPGGIAVDNNGNVYVAGSINNGTDDFSGANHDFHVIKYDSSGSIDIDWTKTYDGGPNASARDITVDAAGNVYVTGKMNGDFYTVKYDSLGAWIWDATYDGGYDDVATGIAVDVDGNVYVTGISNNGSDGDYYTIKYGPSGAKLWEHRHDTGVDDFAYDIYVKPYGNYVYVSGYILFAPGNNVIKYGAETGSVAWPREYVGGQGITVDSDENVYITGSGQGVGHLVYITAKYDSSGTQLWEQIYDSGFPAEGRDIVLDTTGNVYTTGTTWDYYTIKYGPPGNELWNLTYEGLNGAANAIALDASGALYVTGDIWVDVPNPDVDHYDWYTIKYSYLPYMNTKAGNSQTVELTNIGVILTYSSVLSSGNTTATKSDSGEPLPPGYNRVGSYNYITTSATYDGNIEVCIYYDEASVTNENSLSLLHYEDGSWVDVTTSLDTTANIICGTVTSLSPFVVAKHGNGFAKVATGGGEFFADSQSTLPGGRAKFGFVANYKNGNFTGNLEFQYKEAGINLKSKSIDWLTIIGGSVQFRGAATINGSGLYTFLVMADDNGEPGAGVDYFDIMIWEGNNTEVDPYHKAKSEIRKGNIKVHKKNRN